MTFFKITHADHPPSYTDDFADLYEAEMRHPSADGWTVEEVGGLPRDHESYDGMDLVLDTEELDAELHRRIDLEAGDVCGRFVTIAPAQEMRYQAKDRQARAFLETGEVGLFLSREATASGLSNAELAAIVIAKSDEWEDVGSRIEVARLTAKIAVTTAVGRAAKEAAAVVDWEAVLA